MLMLPMVDTAFKRIFANETKPEILINFLNAILECTNDNKIERISFLELIGPMHFRSENHSVLSIRAATKKEEIAQIEIFLDNSPKLAGIVLYKDDYLESLQSSILQNEGQNVSQLILLKIRRDSSKFLVGQPYHSQQKITCLENGTELTIPTILHCVELEKTMSIEPPNEKDSWLLFFKEPLPFVLDDEKTKDSPELDSAVRTLQRISFDPSLKEIYAAKLKGIMDFDSAIADAWQRGIEEGREKSRKRETAKKMLSDKTDEEIASLTQLSVDFVAQLRMDMNEKGK